MTWKPTSEAEGRAQVMHRALGQCEVQVAPDCDRSHPEWHHRMRRQVGGHRPSNGIAACRACHRHIHAHPQQAVTKGWIVLTSMRTVEPVAAWLHPRGEPEAQWVTLTHGGTYM